jgi:hypothetical protein
MQRFHYLCAFFHERHAFAGRSFPARTARIVGDPAPLRHSQVTEKDVSGPGGARPHPITLVKRAAARARLDAPRRSLLPGTPLVSSARLWSGEIPQAA